MLNEEACFTLFHLISCFLICLPGPTQALPKVFHWGIALLLTDASQAWFHQVAKSLANLNLSNTLSSKKELIITGDFCQFMVIFHYFHGDF